MIEQLPASATKIIFATLLAGAVFFLLPYLTSTTAPDSTFTTITGKRISLSQLRGKPVLVTFWATDCPSCLEEIPHLIDIYQHFHPLGLEIIAVAMIYDPPSRVVAMTQAMQIPYDVVLDLKSDHALAFGQVQLTPSTFLISPDGSIAMKTVGLIKPEAISTQLNSLLKG
ncbi:MAG: TlpA family protein disulfide reductase [Methylococcaceae bacterium]|nr:TlpA family protein disulfide reductase [Methylococcaceae bacterium]